MGLKPFFKDIADAIREKDGTAGPIVAGTFPERIRTIPTGTGSPGEPLDPAEVYKATRPADWLPMPEPQDDEMYLLVHIPDGVSALLAFTVTCTDSCTVALGTVRDGRFVQERAESVASNVKYETELFADDWDASTEDGVKQVMVKISGSNLLAWEPSTHSKKGLPVKFANWNVIEIVCRLPNAEKVRCGGVGGELTLQKLRYFTWLGETKVTDMSSMFRACSALMAVVQLDTAKVTNMSYMFSNCYSLIAVPKLDTAQVTNMSYMFYYCFTLPAVPLLDTAKVTNMSYLFGTCYSLTKAPLLDTAKVTNMSYMFSNCYSLAEIPPLDTSQVTNMYNMISYCYALKTVPPLDTAKVTNMSYMFNSCYSLTEIPKLDTTQVTDMSRMFNNCYSLTKIPPLNTAQAVNLNYVFSGCASLIEIPRLNTARATSMNNTFTDCFSLAKVTLEPEIDNWAGCDIKFFGGALGRNALIELFRSLPAVTTGKTLTLTGNPGLAELTDEDKAIAVEKNWTLS